uniref:Uncharacterized protein n=1 Tax=Leersia perrieri TaxID=77586 RepID=A0A0D9WDY1_9ORYZ
MAVGDFSLPDLAATAPVAAGRSVQTLAVAVTRILPPCSLPLLPLPPPSPPLPLTGCGNGLTAFLSFLAA